MQRLLFLLLAGFLAGCDQPPVATQTQAASIDEQQPPDNRVEPGIPRGKATRYGMFKERIKGRLLQDPNAGTGKVIRGSTLEFIEGDTRRIPLRKGVRFGYRYWLKVNPDQQRPAFRRVLIHPVMTLPDASKVSRSERTITKKATHGIVTAIDAYALSEDYELVEGDWTFQLWYQDKLLVEQTFTTYWPAVEAVADDVQQPGPDT